jgi:hypothetical protein
MVTKEIHPQTSYSDNMTSDRAASDSKRGNNYFSRGQSMGSSGGYSAHHKSKNLSSASDAMSGTNFNGGQLSSYSKGKQRDFDRI